MCGITAYCGQAFALPFLMQGLSKLEYRGYDSAGICVLNEEKLLTVKCQGKLVNLEDQLHHLQVSGTVGIGHTRWATHGAPSLTNAHPHMNKDKTIALVHNGIIENYQELKNELLEMHYTFQSETDSEVIVHLLDYYYQGDLLKATHKVLKRLEGSYALCIMSTYDPDTIIVAKKDSPLIIGKVEQGYVAASDIPALLEYTKDMVFLDDHDVAVLKNDCIAFYHQETYIQQKEWVHIPYGIETAQKNGYDTFMLKEIYDQPAAIQDTLRKRLTSDGVMLEELASLDFHQYNQVYFVACGTAYHACLCGAHILEKAVRLPTTSLVASEFRYSDPIIDNHTLVVFVSQSGETADTIAALKLAKSRGATTLAITNVLGSTLSRESDYVLYTYAGPEISVASTKAYTTQLVLLLLLSSYIAQRLGHPSNPDLLEQMARLPQIIQSLLDQHACYMDYAQMFYDHHDVYFLGRQLDYASVLEGALKLKEVSYIHADAYMAGELKHGPIALIEPGTVIITVATQPHIAQKTMSNIQETMARGANVILFATKDIAIKELDNVFILPDVNPLLQPILVSIPLQFLAYYAACLRHCDVDKPRNLAKSVTVE